jgi:uncharacterized membrane protein
VAADEEEGQYRPIEAPVPVEEEEPDEPPIQVDVEPIRRLLRQEIYVVRQELRQEIRQDIRAELHIGPLPHQDTLAGYERIVPGSAERIINAFVAQGEHRQEIESYAVKWDNIRSFAGLGAGLIISILVMILAYDLIRTGHGTEGTILASIDLVGLVAVFVYGTHIVRDERIRKSQIMVGLGERQKREATKQISE